MTRVGLPGWAADGRPVRLVRLAPGQEDLHLVGAWRRFMTEPDSYFRHLLAGDTGG